MKKTKRSLIYSAVALVLCIAMLIGATYAWFTDSVSSSGNIIKSGTLDIEMYWTDDLNGSWHNVEDPQYSKIFNHDKWEPGYTEYKYIKIVNNGNLALNYNLTLTPEGEVGKLAEVINVYFANEAVEINTRDDLSRLSAIGLLKDVLDGGATAEGTLLADGQQSPFHKSKEIIVTIAMSMITTAGNQYQEESVGDGFSITALATQASFEEDSFGSSYDAAAEMPKVIRPVKVTSDVAVVGGKVASETTIQGNGLKAIIPEGVQVDAEKLTVKVTPLETSTSDVTVVDDEVIIPVDVHVEGVADGNTVPIVIELGAIMPKYLNMGNYYLIHVENGVNKYMTYVEPSDDLTAHNQFKYEPTTGELTVSMASFSPVEAVVDLSKKWTGKEDYSWYDANKSEFNIANADQLYAFAKIVGGMAKEYEIDCFDGEKVNLLCDINLNGGKATVDSKTKVFYPIGYVNNTKDKIYDRDDADKGVVIEGVSSTVSSFEGTFDGRGHKVYNFYQNTWEMFGDYNDGYSGTPNYYKDAMGLFGYVKDGTVKNLTVDKFTSDGEFTPTGVIAAFAANSTFENIAITNCIPRVYNTGNGGIVGIGGNYDETSESKLTFKNITVDNTNKISALWGSWDVACGGLMGMFRGYSEVEFKHCRAAAQIDVFNDVCGNYQYYWYRYAGMIIGSLRGRNTTDDKGYTVPDMTGISAEGCTVNFDAWNDYYYCELVANSLASYTHDHQFSRLTEVDSVDAENKTYTVGGTTYNIPDSGRYNYVVVTDKTTPSTEEAECYHFVDGAVWNHADAGEETVNGETVLKEDKQHVYLPFNQLFQGDGWGVKHIPVFDGNESGYDGITVLRNGDSKTKFISKYSTDVPYSAKSGDEIKLSDLVSAKSGAEINDSGVYVTIYKMDDDQEVEAEFIADTENWENGKIKISGQGDGSFWLTIQDYDNCVPTPFYIEVGGFADGEGDDELGDEA